MKFELSMKASSLKSLVVPYKYAVYSNRLDELNDPCEMLYEVHGSSEGASRGLKVPDDVCRAGGMYAFYFCSYQLTRLRISSGGIEIVSLYSVHYFVLHRKICPNGHNSLSKISKV